MISLPSKHHWVAFGVLAAALATVVFVYPLLLATRIPLFDPDEGLHASIAQEMVERGDWVVPRLLGKPFLDKPILYFWAEAASLRLFGTNEAAVRLPGLVFGLLGVVTTGLLAGRLLGRRAGMIAGLFYTTMIFPAALAQVPVHDVALVPWINLALLFFWEGEQKKGADTFCRNGRWAGTMYGWSLHQRLLTLLLDRRRQLICAAGAGLALGLAILTKGLAGVALCGVAYGGYLLALRRLTRAACFRGGAALAIAIALGALWYLAVERQNSGYLRYYFIDRHVLGFATGSQQHGRAPWWFYLPILLVGGLPWISYLPVSILDAWRRKSDAARPVVFLVAWLVGGTMFLSISHSKLITYIWPVLPAVAILASAAWTWQIEGGLGDAARRTMGRVVWSTCLLGPLALPIVLVAGQLALGLHYGAAVWAAAAVVSCAALLPLAAWRAGRYRATLSLATLVVAAQFAVVMTGALPEAARGMSARDLAEHFNETGRMPAQVLIAEERIGSFIFYLRPELRAALTSDRLVLQPLDEPLPRVRGGEQVLAVAERHAPQTVEALELQGVPFEQAGRYRVYQTREILAARCDVRQWR